MSRTPFRFLALFVLLTLPFSHSSKGADEMYSFSHFTELSFASPSDPVLEFFASEVSLEELKSTEMQNFMKRLFEFASGKQKGQEAILVGLAAPQIGLAKRIILVDVKADGKGKVS